MPFTVEDYQKIDLAVLHKYGYLLPIPERDRLTFWNRIGTGILGYADIDFKPNHAAPERGGMRLSGSICEQSFDCVISMCQVASNLGKGGGQWYFLCPVTGQRCRTIFFNGAQFISRQGLGNVHYDSQMDHRSIKSNVSNLLKLREYRRLIDEWIFKPRAKKYYQGKPTRTMKRFLRMKAMARKATDHFTEKFPRRGVNEY